MTQKKALIYFVTDNCNLGCAHCYQVRGLSSREELYVPTLERVLATGDFSRRELLLHGGEPLSIPEKDLLGILKIASKEFSTTQMQTNLTLLTPEMCTAMAAVTENMCLSSSYDFDNARYRPITVELFKEKMQVQYNWLERYPGIVTCLHKGNLTSELVHKVEELVAVGLPAINFTLITTKGDKHGFYNDSVTEVYRLLVKYLTPVLDYCVSKNVSVRQLSNMLTFQDPGRGVDCTRSLCMAKSDIIVVDSRGDVFPCLRLRNSTYKLGNIYEHSWEEIERNYDATKTQVLINNYYADKKPVCSTCVVREYCLDGCEADRIAGVVANTHCAMNLFFAEYCATRCEEDDAYFQDYLKTPWGAHHGFEEASGLDIKHRKYQGL